ncbi:MAG: polysaccharide biosynthesis/export family protein [Acidobacteriota bacterium]
MGCRTQCSFRWIPKPGGTPVRTLLTAALGALLLVPLAAAEEGLSAARAAYALRDLQVSSSDSVEVVVFVGGGGDLECSLYRLDHPPRLVLEFPGVRNLAPSRALPANLKLLSDIQIEEVDLGGGVLTRAVLHLRRPTEVELARSAGLVTLLLRASGRAVETLAELLEAQEEEPAVVDLQETEVPLGEIMPVYLQSDPVLMPVYLQSDPVLMPVYLQSDPSAGWTSARSPAAAAPSSGTGPDPEMMGRTFERPGAPALGPQLDEIPLGVHDLLSIEVFGVSSLDRRVRVSTDGTLNLPLIGKVPAAGLTRERLESEIAERLAQGFVNEPQVNVFVEEFRSRRFSVSGAVLNPGSFELLRPTTLLEALALAGGIQDDRAASRLLIVRQSSSGSKRSLEVDRAVLEAGDMEANLALQPGDLVHVPIEQMLEVSVRGRVLHPDRYRVSSRQGITVMQAVMLAGGVSGRRFGPRRVEILRRQQDGGTRTLTFNLKRIRDGRDPDVALEADDIVVVY